MKVLVLNESEREFDSIKRSQEHSEIFHARRYLEFLHQLEVQDWDVIYLKDEFSSGTNPDVWVDGNGFKRFFDGVHAARAIAELANLHRCSVKKVVVSQTSERASKMRQILLKADVEVSPLRRNDNETSIQLLNN